MTRVLAIAIVASLWAQDATAQEDRTVCRWDPWQRATVCKSDKERIVCRWDRWLRAQICERR